MEKQVSGAETNIDAPIDTVWHAITESKIGLMPGTTVESDWEIGSPIDFQGEFNGTKFHDYGEVVEKKDGKSVGFSHWSKEPRRPANYHIVRYELQARGDDATHVTLTQSNVGYKVDIDAKTRAEFDKNWEAMLAHLKKTAEAG